MGGCVGRWGPLGGALGWAKARATLEKRSLFRFLESEGKLYKKLKDNIFTKSNKLMEKHINNSINNVNIDIVIVR